MITFPLKAKNGDQWPFAEVQSDEKIKKKFAIEVVSTVEDLSFWTGCGGGGKPIGGAGLRRGRTRRLRGRELGQGNKFCRSGSYELC